MNDSDPRPQDTLWREITHLAPSADRREVLMFWTEVESVLGHGRISFSEADIQKMFDSDRTDPDSPDWLVPPQVLRVRCIGAMFMGPQVPG